MKYIVKVAPTMNNEIYNNGHFDNMRLSLSLYNATNVWTSLSNNGIFMYSILTPIICFCGVIGNSMSLLVLSKSDLVCSFYVYLRGTMTTIRILTRFCAQLLLVIFLAIAVVDLASCCTLFVSGIARGVLAQKVGMVCIDALINAPLLGFLGNISIIATLSITIDRVFYLKNPLQSCKPNFCRRKNAIKVLSWGTLIALIFSLPYCFIYKLTDDGSLEITGFYTSRFYAIYSWLDVIVFTGIPLILLTVGNAMLISSIKTARRLQKKCKLLQTRMRTDQTKITITLIAMVFFYMIGDVPIHISSRKIATYILFEGDHETAYSSKWLQIFRQVAFVLNSFYVAMKFVLYAFFCPPFLKAFKSCILKNAKKKGPIEVPQVPQGQPFCTGSRKENVMDSEQFDISVVSCDSGFSKRM